MNSLGILYTTAALMAAVAVACTARALHGRIRLGVAGSLVKDAPEALGSKTKGLIEWPARVGRWLVQPESEPVPSSPGTAAIVC